MDPEGFLNALGEFPAVEAQVALWYKEMARAVDTIAPRRPLPARRAYMAPWYTATPSRHGLEGWGINVINK